MFDNAIERIVFEVVLFLIIFSFMCWLQYAPVASGTNDVPIERQLKEAFTLIDLEEVMARANQPDNLTVQTTRKNRTSTTTKGRPPYKRSKKVLS
jgi:hypothetical protein